MENDKNQCSSHFNGFSEESEINLLDLILVLIKRKKLILFSCLIASMLSLGVSLLLPNIYSATTIILPPENQAPLYVTMLKSRTISDNIIEKFDLTEVYGQQSRSQIYKNLDSYVKISAGKMDGTIKIEVEDKDPKRAAGMADAYVEELKKLCNKIYHGKTAEELQFLEKQLQVASNDLRKAEQMLKVFKDKNDPLRSNSQNQTVIGAISGLNDENDNRKIELGLAILQQNDEQTLQGRALEGPGRSGNQTKQPEKVLGNFAIEDNISEAAVQFGLLLREFRVQAQLYDFLSLKNKEVLHEVAKNLPNIQVVSGAFAADEQSKPKRSLIVLSSTFFAGFLGVLVAFVREYCDRMCEEDRLRLKAIKEGTLGLRGSAGGE